MLDKVKYPAVFVLSARRQDPRSGEVQIRAFADGVTVNSDEEMGQRINALYALEEAGALGYTKTLAHVDDVDQVIAERRAELEAEVASGRTDGAEDADTSPAPEAPRSEEPSNGHSSTNGGNGQGNSHSEAALTILYQGMAPRPTDTRGASGRLLQLEIDGQETQPPAHNIFEIRQYLLEHGYRVHYPAWQVTHRANGRHGQVRREVYVRNDKPEALDLSAIRSSPRATEEQKARWLAQAAEKAEQERQARIATGDLGAAQDRYYTDSFYRQNWTSNRQWRLNGGGVG